MLTRLQVWILFGCFVLVGGIFLALALWPHPGDKAVADVLPPAAAEAPPLRPLPILHHTPLPDRYFRLTVKGQGALHGAQGEEKGIGEVELKYAHQKSVDGVILTDLRVHDERPALLEELGLPCVLIGPELSYRSFATQSAVWHDDAEGIRSVVRHLVELGHTHIAHVAGPQNLVHGRSRRRAWSAGLAAAGLPEGPRVEADFSAESGARSMAELLQLADRPTAVVFANDLMATAGLSLALSRGISVPGEISVTGFDDIELAAHLQPSLTTVTTDVLAWGRAAATRLLELVDHQPPTPHDLPDSRLVVRSSTGPRDDRHHPPR